jgi:DNA-binding transcriptional regulator GbsR (MarR family)
LLHANLIKDITKIDERKRYFVFNDDYIKIRFEKIILMMKEELKILDDLTKFKTNTQNPDSKFEIYRALLKNNAQNIEQTLEKL